MMKKTFVRFLGRVIKWRNFDHPQPLLSKEGLGWFYLMTRPRGKRSVWL